MKKAQRILVALVLSGCGDVGLQEAAKKTPDTSTPSSDTPTSVSYDPLGEKGPTGDPGPQGPAGDKGATGDQGPTGDPGLAGLQGPVGDVGPASLQGLPGPVGDKGPTGDPGLAGPHGLTGLQGPVGAKGLTGDATTTPRLAIFDANGVEVQWALPMAVQFGEFDARYWDGAAMWRLDPASGIVQPLGTVVGLYFGSTCKGDLVTQDRRYPVPGMVVSLDTKSGGTPDSVVFVRQVVDVPATCSWHHQAVPGGCYSFDCPSRGQPYFLLEKVPTPTLEYAPPFRVGMVGTYE